MKEEEDEEKKHCFPHAEYTIVIMSLINCFLF